MSKNQIRTLMCVLCLAALFAIIAGCEGKATKETKATGEMKPAVAEKPGQAAKPAAEKPKPEPAKPSAEKPKAEPVKPVVAEKGPTAGPFDFMANWMDEPGFITNWLIAGPFPNPGERPDNNGFNVDYLKNYGGELGIVPTNGMEIKKDDANIVKWLPYKATATDISFFDVEHLKLEPQQEDILCYAACWLDCDSDKDVEIRVGSDDGYKLWIDNKLIAEQNVYRAMEMDQETYKVKLNKGMNLILIKVTQDWGEYGFMMRVVGADGKAVPGIKTWD
jgi:hypothetical protein